MSKITKILFELENDPSITSARALYLSELKAMVDSSLFTDEEYKNQERKAWAKYTNVFLRVLNEKGLPYLEEDRCQNEYPGETDPQKIKVKCELHKGHEGQHSSMMGDW